MLTLDVIDPNSADAPARMDRACRELGFFRIPAALVAPGAVDAAMADASAFFDLPEVEKSLVLFPEPGYPYGYSPFRFESLAGSLGDETPPDLKESLSVGPDCMGLALPAEMSPEEAWIRSPSQWPANPVSLRTSWEVCFRALAAVSDQLLSVMAVALDLPADYFSPLIDRPSSAMRALNYPSIDAPAGADDRADAGTDDRAKGPAVGSLRAGAHSDYGTVTILATDEVPGLEVQRPDGSWQAVAHVPDTYVVNLGDSIAQWTNDRYRSTVHRVTTVSSERRQSLAFFHTANWDATIECLPTCQSTDDPPRYPPVLAGPWLMKKFQASVG